jgi:hypothetical protein
MSGADPDFAHDDVLGHDFLVAGGDHELRALLGRLEAFERGAEDAVGVRHGLGLGLAEGHADLGPGTGLAVDGGLSGLQDGVIGEETVDL